MTDINKDLAIAQIVSLMTSYSFDTNQRNPEELVQEWRKTYDVNWIHLATIEALYLGRYKAVSIEQIMYGWLRIGQPTTHFGGDFERVISRKLPRHLGALDSIKDTADKTEIVESSPSTLDSTENLDTEESSQKKESQPDATPPNNPLISTKVTPVPKGKPILPYSPKKASSKPEFSTNSDRSKSKGIRIFQPLPDASGFFQKLKDLARNQRKKEN